MKIKPCKKCVWYSKCFESARPSEDPLFPQELKDRIYNIFVEGWDCFMKDRSDEDE